MPSKSVLLTDDDAVLRGTLAEVDYLHAASGLGATLVIAKPFHGSEFRDAVEACMERR